MNATDSQTKHLQVDVSFGTTAIFSPESSCSLEPSPIPRTSTRRATTMKRTTTMATIAEPIPASFSSYRSSKPCASLDDSPYDWFTFEEEVLAKRSVSSREREVETIGVVADIARDTRFVVDSGPNTMDRDDGYSTTDAPSVGFDSGGPNQRRKRCRHHRSIVEINFADVLPQLEDFPVEEVQWEIGFRSFDSRFGVGVNEFRRMGSESIGSSFCVKESKELRVGFPRLGLFELLLHCKISTHYHSDVPKRSQIALNQHSGYLLDRFLWDSLLGIQHHGLSFDGTNFQ
eukprot:jgi/Psemu1/24611/gm1.24611_g